MKANKIVIGILGEGGLIFIVAVIGWAAHMPLLFASLGPTAYEMVEQPQMRSARPYNVVVGHLFALGAGFFSLWVLAAWSAPKVTSAGFISSTRIWAVVLAVVLTTLLTLVFKASQPAALATALLVSLGSMQTRRDALAIVVGVLILAAIGEPVRRIALRDKMSSSGQA